MFRNLSLWLPSYLKQFLNPNKEDLEVCDKTDILFTICDHYEPFWNKVNYKTAYYRVKKWMDCYQPIAEKHKDSFGKHPLHCFFYPEEEYKKDFLNMLGEICRNGYGETEVHLHHDNDTAENLRNNLLNFKKVLSETHGLLARECDTNEVKYGFIHGNWALNNSRPDGRWCGVNNEISVLQETGCYADFTMPSAPSDTQTKTINSIYYAIGDPYKPKSHNTGIPAVAGVIFDKGLLCLQGPLCLNFNSRKLGIFPRIENGRLASNTSVDSNRISLWKGCNIHVHGRPNIIFIKLYCHGTQERDMDFFFERNGLDSLYSNLEQFCSENSLNLHFVSTRIMYNIVRGLEVKKNAPPQDLYDFKLKLTH